MTLDPARHWETVYKTRQPDELSWFQAEAHLSRDLVIRAAPSRDARIVDVGGGASTLADALLSDGYTGLTVLDLSASALEHSRKRLRENASQVSWLVADVLDAGFLPASIDVWHDRAVFHFLTRPEDRARYISQVRRALRPGGHVIVATFAEDGPTRCSGLDVQRYSPVQLHAAFGPDFTLETSVRENHRTPSGSQQAFIYCVFRLQPGDPVNQ